MKSLSVCTLIGSLMLAPAAWAGERTITVQQVVVDGQVESESQTGSTVTRASTSATVALGSSRRSSPTWISTPRISSLL